MSKPANETEQTAARPARENVGTIRTCPSCGNTVESFQARCSACGHEFRGTSEVSSGILKFVEQISQIDYEIAEKKFSTGHEQESRVKTLEERKRRMISNFIIPNTREDITETMLFASSKIREVINTTVNPINDKNWNIIWTQTWVNKARQIYAKAQIVMPDEADKLIAFNQALNEGMDFIKKDKKKRLVKASIVSLAPIIIVGLLIVHASGIYITIPTFHTIPKERVSLAGFFAGSLVITEDSELATTRDGNNISISLTVTAVKTIWPDIENQIHAFITQQGWNVADCSPRLSYSQVELSGLSDVWGPFFRMDSSDRDAVISSLAGMVEGETRRLIFTMATEKLTPGSKKRAALAAMNLSMLQLSIMPSYYVRNNTINSGRSMYIE